METTRKTLLVGLWAGPGSGKSTGAAYIFARLKMLGNLEVELVTEYAKDKVFQDDLKVFQNQFYVVGKQTFRESRLRGKVDVIVTDSPSLMGAIYSKDKPYFKEYAHVLKCMYDEVPHFDYFVERTKPYSQNGRFQTEAGATMLDREILDFMKEQGINYELIGGNESGYNFVVDDVLKAFNATEVVGHDRRCHDD